MDVMRVYGGVGYIKGLSLERYYRDAPPMTSGKGTNKDPAAAHRAAVVAVV
jgi:alkylation response protein AidB-like acyl-CoA dehydrogenase